MLSRMKLAPDHLLSTRLTRLAEQQPATLKDELKTLRQDAVKLGVVVAFDRQARELFGDRFQTEPQPKTQTATSSFAATHQGRAVGGTVGLLRPSFQQIGVAAFRPMDDVVALAKTGKPPPTGLLILDTNLGELEKTADPGWSKITLDHHGPVHGKGKGRGTNSTSLLVDRFDDALKADVAGAKRNPAFTGALLAIEKASKQHGLSSTTAQKEQAAAGLLQLNLKEISSDNVGDGLGWPVWMAKNQARVLLDGDLRTTIREATLHEDFAVFGGNYLNGKNDVADLSPAIKLQSAIFLAYDDALRSAGVSGSDRVPSDAAEAAATSVGKAIDALLKDPAAVERGCHDFFFQVGMALTTVEEHALIKGASIADGKGGYALPVFDVSKLPPELGTFARWAVPPLFGAHELQMTISPAQQAGRSTVILAIPDERTLPSGKGLLSILERLNALERSKTPAGEKTASWFGRDVVLLPSAPGSVLRPEDVRRVVEEARLLQKA